MKKEGSSTYEDLNIYKEELILFVKNANDFRDNLKSINVKVTSHRVSILIKVC